MEGKAVHIVVKDGKEFKFQEEEMRKIIEENKVGDLPVVVISVAGVFRKGKSFLLNFFLRYLDAESKDNWLDSQEKLKGFGGNGGFEWRGGSVRHTEGILIWNKVFKLPNPNADGKEVAVILMDTQGTFDGISSMKDNNMIFILSVLLSSVQIYNVSRHINESDLQNLEYFVDFAKVLQTHSAHKAFQSLKFLVRDWQFPYDYDYGEEGGNKFLDKILKTSAHQEPSLKNVRENIRSAFEELTCFLLPHPGKSVARSPKFEGSLNEVNEKFLQHMKELTSVMFDQQNLRVKTIMGERITCNDFIIKFSAYMEDCRNNKLPEPQTLLQDITKLSLSNLVDRCMQKYRTQMEQFCNNNKIFVLPETVDKQHEKCTNDTMEHYEQVNKLGGVDEVAHFKQQLKEKNIADCHDSIVLLNEARKSGNTYILHFPDHSAYAAHETIVPNSEEKYNIRFEVDGDGETITDVNFITVNDSNSIEIPIRGTSFIEWKNKSRNSSDEKATPENRSYFKRAKEFGAKRLYHAKKNFSSNVDIYVNILLGAVFRGKRYRLNFANEVAFVFHDTIVVHPNRSFQGNMIRGTVASKDGGEESIIAIDLDENVDVEIVDFTSSTFKDWSENIKPKNRRNDTSSSVE